MKRELTVETSERYVYDLERVQGLYDVLLPDPDLYGDEDSGGNGGMWPTADVEYDPDA